MVFGRRLQGHVQEAVEQQLTPAFRRAARIMPGRGDQMGSSCLAAACYRLRDSSRWRYPASVSPAGISL